jgi:tRNA(Ile)-lysidine synthase
VRAPDAGWALEASGPIPLAEYQQARHTDEVAVEAAQLGSGLVVRSRHDGDRLRPLGLGGTKKVQDLFVDRKVRRDQRDRVPIVTDDRGRIVWVAGHALAEEFRVTEGTNAVVVLKLRRI